MSSELASPSTDTHFLLAAKLSGERVEKSLLPSPPAPPAVIEQLAVIYTVH